MSGLPVIAIFDIGKSNKKLICFDEKYQIVFEKTVRIQETTDEDGYPCEDLQFLTEFILHSLESLLKSRDLDIRAVNFSAYGASLVCTDHNRIPVAPLYNYLNPYPEVLLDKFYREYGGKKSVTLRTASPALGNLNSGLQMFRIKQLRPDLFNRIHYFIHLPQYLSSLVTAKAFSGYTSIGCHTHLWNFTTKNYDFWVHKEEILEKLPPIFPETVHFKTDISGHYLMVGTGIHDSSAALIPYMHACNEPFILLSTGTWSITLNPFNKDPLTEEELNQDCLCYLTSGGQPVKASRFLLGPYYESEISRIAGHFHMDPGIFPNLAYDPEILQGLPDVEYNSPEQFSAAVYAYHQMMRRLVAMQKSSIGLVLGSNKISNIYVDGGFSHNNFFLYLLKKTFPEMKVIASPHGYASALGAALMIHSSWNKHPISFDLY
jgi:sugar (pentulose or hexulose) kinase